MAVAQGAVLAAWALLMALLEIEIEGRHGWAERLPTWYRTRGPAARVYHLIGGNRPLTGYHLMMFPIPLLMLHYPYVAGAGWSLAAEASTIAVFLAWIIAWDYLWFVLDPHWGIARFRRGEVWWYPGAGSAGCRWTTSSRSAAPSRSPPSPGPWAGDRRRCATSW